MGERTKATCDRPRVLAFGAMLWLTYAFFIASPSWNPNARFDLTLALVHHQTLQIDAYHVNTGDKARLKDHYYCDKAPGLSFLAVPVYAAFAGVRHWLGWAPASVVALGRAAAPNGDGRADVMLSSGYRWGLYVSSLFTSGLAGAALGMMLLCTARKAGKTFTDATAIAMAMSLGTLLFPYSTSFYAHVPAAAFAFAAWFFVASARVPRILIGGALASASVACEWPAALLAMGLTLFVVHQHSWRALVPWLSGALPVTLALAVYNQAAFGSPLGLGYAHLADPQFAVGMSHGLMGVGWPSPGVLIAMLFGRARGLFYTAPILLLATWGVVSGKGPTRALVAALVTAFLLLSAGYFMWWGGAAFGPRHVIAALPFWCLGLLWIWPSRTSQASQPWRAHLNFACLAWSVAAMIFGTAVGFEAPFPTDVLFRYTYPLAVRGQIPFAPGTFNLGRLIGLPGPLSLAPLLFLWVLYIGWVWRWLPLPPRLQPKD